MARITGTQTRSVYALGTTSTNYGTAVAAGAGDRIRGNIAANFTVQELIKNAIGSGLIMQDDIIAGRLTPILTLSGDMGFRSGPEKLAAQFFGSTSVGAELTGGQGDYLHTFVISPNANPAFGTFAYEATSTDVIELPSCATRTLTTSFTQTTELVQFSAELLGNDAVLEYPENSNADIAAATMVDTECVVVKFEDTFRLALQSAGALDEDDQVDILGYNRTLTRPQDFSGLVKGSAGNPPPLADQILSGTLNVSLEALDNIDFYLAWLNGDTFKCELAIEGSQIGTGNYKTYREVCPRMKLVQPPVYNVTESGFNSVDLTFTLLQASANPTGMVSTMPYTQIINTKNTAYIAVT